MIAAIRANLSFVTYAFIAFCCAGMGRPAHAGNLEDWIARHSLPAQGTGALSSVPLVNDVPDGDSRFSVFLTRRAAGSRTPIHTHESGGVTCVIEGEMTLYLEGQEPARKGPGECYFMPSGVRMFGYNSGRTVATLFDFFKLDRGHRHWTPGEKGTDPAVNRQFGDK